MTAVRSPLTATSHVVPAVRSPLTATSYVASAIRWPHAATSYVVSDLRSLSATRCPASEPHSCGRLCVFGTVAAILAVNLGFALRATPGNVGGFQFMYAISAAGFGMDKDQAVAVAFLIQAQQIIPVTLLGVALAPDSFSAESRSCAPRTRVCIWGRGRASRLRRRCGTT
jgi:hypothetical protein